jgi:uncharacterized membrane protein YfcA
MEMMVDVLAVNDFSEVVAFLIVAALAAGLARGFSGFGAALIFVPLASAIVGPQVAVPLLMVVDGVMTVGLIPGALRKADRRDVLTMTLGAVFGVPAGVYLLSTLDPSTIRWAIVVVVVILLALLMSGWRYHGRPKPPLTVFVGLLAGFFSGVAQIGGPPVVAYWLGGAIPAMIVRANIILYFAISTVLSAIGYVWGGLITVQILILALTTAPLYGLGVWLGSRMFGLVSERTFRGICYAMIAAAALTSMPILDNLLRGG